MQHIPFHTTHWSVVLAAKGDGTKAKSALRELCELYRTPILHYIERTIRTDAHRRYGGMDAEDLTHDFLAKLLEGNMFKHLERRKSKFRTYLLGAIRHFLSHARQYELSDKRGGGIVHLPIHDDIPQSSDTMFDRDWAVATIDRAIASLGTSPETQTLLPYLTRELTAEEQTLLVAELGKSENAVKVALHRLRKKFREHVREQIGRTVESEAEVDGELDYLIRAYC